METNDGWVIVPGEPVGKARPRTVTVNGFVQTFTPKTTREYEAKIKRFYKQQKGAKFSKELPVKVIIRAVCKIQRVIRKSEQNRQKRAKLDLLKSLTWTTLSR